MKSAVSRILLLAVLAVCAETARAGRFMTGEPTMMPPTPEALKKSGFEQRLDAQVPLDLVFRDERGEPIRLGDLIHDKPVLLNLVYFECPMLCTEVLNGVLSAVKQLKFDAGKEYLILTISFDHDEGPELAAAKKAHYLAEYGRPGAEAGWRFLTGDEASIQALTEAVGFKFAYDEKTDQFAHASGIMVLTPGGRMSHYFFGVYYSAPDLRLSLVEASSGKIGSPVDQIMLFCFHYDPTTGKYTAAIMNIIRAVALAVLAALALFVTGVWRVRARGLRPAAGNS